MPSAPRVERYPPDVENLCTLFPWSETQTVPFLSIAMPFGEVSCPSAVPTSPHFVMNAPVEENSSTRWFEESVTHTWPAPSTATPLGSSNWPSPVPPAPQVTRNVPAGPNFWIRLFRVSAT